MQVLDALMQGQRGTRKLYRTILSTTPLIKQKYLDNHDKMWLLFVPTIPEIKHGIE